MRAKCRPLEEPSTHVQTLADLRIAVIPQRWPARRGGVWWLRVDTHVIQNPLDLRALGNEREQAHLSATHRALPGVAGTGQPQLHEYEGISHFQVTASRAKIGLEVNLQALDGEVP